MKSSASRELGPQAPIDVIGRTASLPCGEVLSKSSLKLVYSLAPFLDALSSSFR